MIDRPHSGVPLLAYDGGVVWILAAIGLIDQPEPQMVGRFAVPFESRTNDDNLLKNARGMTVYDEGKPAFELACHPRHSKAYQSLKSFSESEIFYEDGVQSVKNRKIRIVIDEKKVASASGVDEDGNTLLNRLLLSHFLMSEEEALSYLPEFQKRNLLSASSNRLGQTTLMLAIESGWPALVEQAILLKPEFNAIDSEGRTAVDYINFIRAKESGLYSQKRPTFNGDLIADALYDAAPRQDKVKISKQINIWLENPYGNRANLENEEITDYRWTRTKKSNYGTP